MYLFESARRRVLAMQWSSGDVPMIVRTGNKRTLFDATNFLSSSPDVTPTKKKPHKITMSPENWKYVEMYAKRMNFISENQQPLYSDAIASLTSGDLAHKLGEKHAESLQLRHEKSELALENERLRARIRELEGHNKPGPGDSLFPLFRDLS